MTWVRTSFVALVFLGVIAVGAQRIEDDKRAGRDAAAPNAGEESEVSYSTEHLSQTSHTVIIDGAEIAYTATAGNFILKEESGKKKASYFFISYHKDGVEDLSRRPLTFSFNGGPGSSSVWLHLGAFGPRRVKMGEDGAAPEPPFELIENEYSILDKTDLVFMDPVSTGFSRPIPGEDAGQFHGVMEDVEWNAEFIRLYVERNNRLLSPLFLAGESYGTYRASMLAHDLQGKGMYLSGVILVSAFLNPSLARGQGDLQFILELPTYTATAWFHRKLDAALQGDLRKTLDEVERFAFDEYLPALARGAGLPPERRRHIARQLARYTGLSEDFVERSNLRLRGFTTELLKERNLIVGAYDSRYTGPARNSGAGSFTAEPSISVVMGAYATTIKHYLRNELKYDTELPYAVLGNVGPWNWSTRKGGATTAQQAPDAGAHLAGALLQNPRLKVLLASGYFDMVTDYFVSDYVFSHFDLPDELRANVRTAYYEAGHMMYVRQSALAKMKRDLDAFLDWAIPGKR